MSAQPLRGELLVSLRNKAHWCSHSIEMLQCITECVCPVNIHLGSMLLKLHHFGGHVFFFFFS